MIKSIIALALFATLVAGHHGTVNSKQQVKVKELYDSVVTKEYNALVRPYGVNGTDATFISVQLKDLNVINVDESKGIFTFQSYVRKSWVDPRLAYNDTEVSYIPVKECKTLWTPDLFFLNGVDVSTFPVNFYHIPSRALIFPTGRVFFSVKFTQSILCPGLFTKGAKEVVCPVRIGSYGHFDDELKVAYKEGVEGVTTVKDVVLPNFTFGGVTTYPTCDGVAKFRSSDEAGHDHSCIQFDVKFTRA